MSEVAEERLFDNRTPESVIADAEERYGPFASRVCLFSGGNDSLAVAHRCRDFYDTLVWVDTGTAVPGVEEFVREAAEWLGKPVEVYQAPDGEYRRIVLGSQEFRNAFYLASVEHEELRTAKQRERDEFKVGVDLGQPPIVPPPLAVAEFGERYRAEFQDRDEVPPKSALGFPGPMQHTRCYVNLKERAIEGMLRLHKGEDRSNRVLALTGIRRAESRRRKSRADITKRGALVFANPLIDWTTPDLHRYRADHDFIESDVAALLHRSGECNCGAYAAPGEREMLRSLFPEWFEATIEPIEREAQALGLPCAVWGSGRDFLDAQQVPAAGELCSDCQLRLGGPSETAGVGAPGGTDRQLVVAATLRRGARSRAYLELLQDYEFGVVEEAFRELLSEGLQYLPSLSVVLAKIEEFAEPSLRFEVMWKAIVASLHSEAPEKFLETEHELYLRFFREEGGVQVLSRVDPTNTYAMHQMRLGWKELTAEFRTEGRRGRVRKALTARPLVPELEGREKRDGPRRMKDPVKLLPQGEE